MKLFADICFWVGVTLTVLITWLTVMESEAGGVYAGGLLLAAVPVAIGWLIRSLLTGPKQ